VVIFATNLVSNFDQAFESRILKHIHFPLPNEDARIAIIKKTIPRRLPLEGSLTEQHLREISSLCEGFSGREIKGAIQECLLSKASEEGQNAVFCFEDFKNAFINKADSLKRLEEEKQKDKKAKILKALTNSKSLNTDTKDDKNDGEKSRTD
jgi:AAA+ superfamily predicted ATPase